MSLLLGTFHGIFAVVALLVLVVKLLALADAVLQPSAAFPAAEKGRKAGWVVGLVIACLLQGIGLLGIAALVAAIVYLVDVRPALRQVRGR